MQGRDELLAASGDTRPLCGPFSAGDGDDEAYWLLTLPQQYETLVAKHLFVPSNPSHRIKSTTVPYQRPADRGEIDFSKFPSGDDPF